MMEQKQLFDLSEWRNQQTVLSIVMYLVHEILNSDVEIPLREFMEFNVGLSEDNKRLALDYTFAPDASSVRLQTKVIEYE